MERKPVIEQFVAQLTRATSPEKKTLQKKKHFLPSF